MQSVLRSTLIVIETTQRSDDVTLARRSPHDRENIVPVGDSCRLRQTSNRPKPVCQLEGTHEGNCFGADTMQVPHLKPLWIMDRTHTRGTLLAPTIATRPYCFDIDLNYPDMPCRVPTRSADRSPETLGGILVLWRRATGNHTAHNTPTTIRNNRCDGRTGTASTTDAGKNRGNKER